MVHIDLAILPGRDAELKNRMGDLNTQVTVEVRDIASYHVVNDQAMGIGGVVVPGACGTTYGPLNHMSRHTVRLDRIRAHGRTCCASPAPSPRARSALAT